MLGCVGVCYGELGYDRVCYGLLGSLGYIKVYHDMIEYVRVVRICLLRYFRLCWGKLEYIKVWYSDSIEIYFIVINFLG